MPGIHFREVVCMLGIFGLFLQAAAGHILYLALHLESGSFPRPLPPDRERAAFADLQKGGAAAAQARDTLIRHNLRLVAHICKKYYAGNSAQDDMISIGTIGLIKAVDTFDPAKGKRFASYASRCIENELRMDLRRWRRTGAPKRFSVTRRSSPPCRSPNNARPMPNGSTPTPGHSACATRSHWSWAARRSARLSPRHSAVRPRPKGS